MECIYDGSPRIVRGLYALETGPTDERKINIYPKGLNELVGIKFVNKFSGKFLIPDFQYTRSDSF